MTLSPPVVVPLFLAVALSAASWLMPIQRVSPASPGTQMTIGVPAAVHAQLAAFVKDRKNAEGLPLTVERLIADLAGRVTAGDEAAPTQKRGASDSK